MKYRHTTTRKLNVKNKNMNESTPNNEKVKCKNNKKDDIIEFKHNIIQSTGNTL